jgi:hypothetical protein
MMFNFDRTAQKRSKRPPTRGVDLVETARRELRRLIIMSVDYVTCQDIGYKIARWQRIQEITKAKGQQKR